MKLKLGGGFSAHIYIRSFQFLQIVIHEQTLFKFFFRSMSQFLVNKYIYKKLSKLVAKVVKSQ